MQQFQNSNSMIGCGLCLLAMLMLACAGCDGAENDEDGILSQPIGSTEIRPRSTPGLASGAVDAIADARCEREIFCFNIGPGKPYATKLDCIRRMRARWVDDLNVLSCTRGVDEAALVNCLREIRDTNCSDFTDSLARLVECREDLICPRQR